MTSAEFEKHLAAAELEYLKAVKQIPEELSGDERLERLELYIAIYIRHRVLLFAQAAMNENPTPTMLVRQDIENYLQSAIGKAFSVKHPHAGTARQDESLGRLRSLVWLAFQTMGGWEEIQRALLERAELEKRSMQEGVKEAARYAETMLAAGNWQAQGSEQRAEAESVSGRRAMTVARLIEELQDVKPGLIDEADLEKRKAEHPDMLLWEVLRRHQDKTERVLYDEFSRRQIRLAQELAAAHHGVTVATIQTDWRDHKPAEFRRGN